VGINIFGEIDGVRVVSHRETPGLGDAIEANRSDWILSFDGRSLLDPFYNRWAVRRDGGVFDQFTGATITPRAVVTAVRDALVYFESHRDVVFAPLPEMRPADDAVTEEVMEASPP
jgi:electron transport complex protein RnfG